MYYTHKGKCLPCTGFTTGVTGFFVGGKVDFVVSGIEGGVVTRCLSSAKIGIKLTVLVQVSNKF